MRQTRLIGPVLAVATLLGATAQIAKAQDDDGHPPVQRHLHYEVLHNFQGQPDAQGNVDPLIVRGLVVDSRGTIYGGSLFGGAPICAFAVDGVCLLPSTSGAEFRLDAAGRYTLFANSGLPGAPANDALGPLLLDDAGKVLFSAEAGGLPSFFAGGNELGGLFSLDPHTGQMKNLFTFTGPPVDGQSPSTNVIRDVAGNVYGATLHGGQSPSFFCGLPELQGCGTVYKLDAKTFEETLLHTFTFDDGDQPVGVAVDKSGNVIGAASLGDDTSCPDVVDVPLGCGAIFRIDAAGNFSLLHEFHHSARCVFHPCPPPPATQPELLGWNPQFVVVDERGDTFGVTGAGGKFGLGVIFKLDAAGEYSVLHHFAGPGDGFDTQQILLKDGFLYGINLEGGDTLDCDFGSNGCGTIFRLNTRTGRYVVLHTFSANEAGTTPTALAFDHNGDLVGANLFGGNSVFDPNVCTGGGGCGNVFRLRLGDRDEDQ